MIFDIKMKRSTILLFEVLVLFGMLFRSAAAAVPTDYCKNMREQGFDFYLPISGSGKDADDWRVDLTAAVSVVGSGVSAGDVIQMEVVTADSSTQYQCTQVIPDVNNFSCNSTPANSMITGVYLTVITDNSVTGDEDSIHFSITQTGSDEVVWESDTSFSVPFCYSLYPEFEIDSNGVLTKYTGTDTHIVIPDGVTAIAVRVFENNDKITSITIPTTVSSIGNYAFSYCYNLETVTMAEGVTSIGSNAFTNCYNLNSIALPYSIESIGTSAFYTSTELKVNRNSYAAQWAVENEHWFRLIEESDFSIIDGVLYNYTGTEANVVIPEGVTAIAPYAFYKHGKLPNYVKSVIIPPGVTSIGTNAFLGFSLKIFIPSSVIFIDNDINNYYDTMIYADSGSYAAEWAVEHGYRLHLNGEGDFTVIDGVLYSYTGGDGEITIPEGVTSIAAKAFVDDTNIIAVTIPDGVVSIGYGAFGNCHKLAKVKIPDTVTFIDDWFGGVYATIYANSGSYAADWAIENGYKLHLNGEGDFTVIDGLLYSYTGNSVDVVIPESVTEIVHSVFYSNDKIISVTIPSSVTLVSDSVFAGCENLQNVTIAEGVISIGDRAFYGCHNLTFINLPFSIKTIGRDAFGNCYNLINVTIAEGTTSIGENAFTGCSYLKTLSLPRSIESIGKDAFGDEMILVAERGSFAAEWAIENGYKLRLNGEGDFTVIDGVLYTYTGTSSNIVIPDGVISIADNAFSDNDKITRVTIPDSVVSIGAHAFPDGVMDVWVPDSVKDIGYDAFSVWTMIHANPGSRVVQWAIENGCRVHLNGDKNFTIIDGILYSYIGNASTVTIPEGVTEIGTRAFYGTGIKSVRMPSTLVRIGFVAFSGCSNLKTVELNKGLLEIGNNAFWNTAQLTSMKLPSTLKKIGSYSFGKSMVSIMIPDSVISIGMMHPSTIIYANPGSYAAEWALSKGHKLQLIGMESDFMIVDGVLLSYSGSDKHVTIPDGVTAIYSDAFYEDQNIESITIPGNVDSIGIHTFYGCSNLRIVTFEEGLQSIQEGAFAGCTSLSEIIIPQSVTSISPWYPFSSGTMLKVYRDSYASEWAITNGQKFRFIDEGDFTIIDGFLYYYTGKALAVNLPDGVKEIGPYAFTEGTVKIVMLPDGLQRISDFAFSGVSISRLTIPDSVSFIGELAFGAVSGHSEIDLYGSADSYAAYYAMQYGYRFHVNDGSEFTIINGVLTAYNGNDADVVIPDSVTEIGARVFYQNTKLTGITIPDSVIKIGDRAFSGCTSLIEVYLPDSVITLGKEVFNNCTELESVRLSESLAVIPYMAFNYCSSLKSIELPPALTEIEDEAFTHCSELKGINFPVGLLRIGDFVFRFDKKLELPDFPNGLQIIGKMAFMEVPILEVEIPASVVSIGDYAFGSNAETSVILGKVNSAAERYAINYHLPFLDLSDGKLSAWTGTGERYIVPDSVTEIGAYAFCNASGLEEIVVPDNVTVINVNAFGGLSRVTILCRENSAAYQFAEEHGIPYRLSDGKTDRIRILRNGKNVTGTELNFDGMEENVALAAVTEPFTAEVTWASSAPAVASVDHEGMVTFHKTGSAEISARTTDGVTASVMLNIGTKAMSLQITAKSASHKLVPGMKLELNALVTPLGTKNKKIKWTSNHPTVVAVSAKGHVTAKKTGTAFITATLADDETITAQYYIEVYPAVTGVQLLKEDGTIAASKEKILLDTENKTFYQFGTIVLPSDAYTNISWTSSVPSVASVSPDGLVTVLSGGTVVITATDLNTKKSASVMLMVTAPVQLDSLSISGPEKIAVKKTGTFTALFDQKYQPSNPAVTWESSDPTVAKITQKGVVTGLKGGDVMITACSKEDATVCAEFPLTVVPAVTKVRIKDMEDGSGQIDIASVKTYRLEAETDPEGAIGAVTWKSSVPKIAAVDENGTVTGLKPGIATITATAADGSKKNSSVKIKVVSGVQPGSLRISGLAEVTKTQTITLKAEFDQDYPPTNQKVTWESQNEDIASVVSTTGAVTGLEEGEAVIFACSAEDTSQCADAVITVLPKVDSIMLEDRDDGTLTIDLGSTGFDYEKTTYQLGAVIEPEDASEEIIWKSSAPTVAKVDENGLVTGLKAGTATITGTAADGSRQSVSAQIRVTVDPQITAFTVTGPEQITAGKTGTMKASLDQAVKPAKTVFVWDTSDLEIASVSKTGVVTGISGGSVKIIACVQGYEDHCRTFPIEIVPISSQIIIPEAEDGTALIDLGISPELQLSARIEPEKAAQNVTWKSSAAAVATVDANGLVTAKKAGKAVITATAADGSKVSSRVTITITRPVHEIELSADTAELKAGGSMTLQADVLPADAANKKLVWHSSDPDTVSVSMAGVVTAAVVDDYTDTEIWAEAADGYGAVSEPVTVTVIPVVREITFEEGTAGTVRVGNTLQLHPVVVPDAADHSMNWKSGAKSIAEVDGNGLVTGVKPGKVVITATAGDGSGVRGLFMLTVVSANGTSSVQPLMDAVWNGSPFFTEPELTIHVGESLTPEVENPMGMTYVITAAGDAGIVSEKDGVFTGEAAGDVMLFLADAGSIEILDRCTLHVTAPEGISEETAESLQDEESPAEETPETEASAESGLHFTVKEMNLLLGESLIPEVVNPEDALYIITMAETNAICEEYGVFTGLREGDVTLFLVDAETLEITDQCLVHVVSKLPATAEISADAEANEGQAETTPADETETETGGPRFAAAEVTLVPGESVVLAVVNPNDEAVLVGLSGDTEAVLWDEASRTLAAIREGELNAFLASPDPFEVKDLCAIHILAEKPAEPETGPSETEEIPADNAETEEPSIPAETEVPAEETEPVAEEPAVPEGTEAPAEGDAPAETTEGTEENGSTEETPEPAAPEAGQPAETPEAPAEEPFELTIRDLPETGLAGTAESALKIERERFSADAEAFGELEFKIENEAVAKLTERSTEETAMYGIEIRLLASGETRLLIGFKDEEPLMKIRIISEPQPVILTEEAPAVEPTAVPMEVIPEPAAAVPAEIPAEPEAPAAPEPEPEPEPEPAEEPVPEPEPDPVSEPAPEESGA